MAEPTERTEPNEHSTESIYRARDNEIKGHSNNTSHVSAPPPSVMWHFILKNNIFLKTYVEFELWSELSKNGLLNYNLTLWHDFLLPNTFKLEFVKSKKKWNIVEQAPSPLRVSLIIWMALRVCLSTQSEQVLLFHQAIWPITHKHPVSVCGENKWTSVSKPKSWYYPQTMSIFS